jgi:hypothetical protein
MDRPWIRVAAAAGFLGFGLLLIYDFWKQPYNDGLQSLPVAIQVALPVLAYAGTGFVIGRWWVIPLLAIPVLFAIPAGAITADEDQLSVHVAYYWATILFLGPIALAGMLARWSWDKHRGKPSLNCAEAPGESR